LGHYGVICLYIYTLFIIYIAIENISDGTFETHKSEVSFVTEDVANLAGTFALSCMLHNAAIPIFRQNRNQKNNTRDLSLAFFLTFLIYFLIGFFGSLGILGKTPKNCQTANNVMDFFDKDDILPFLIEIIYLSHLLTAFPIVNYLARSQILKFILGRENIPNIYKDFFNLGILSICLIFGLLNVNPDIVIAIDGAIMGLFIIYVVPIKLHFKCLNVREEKIYEDLNKNFEQMEESFLLKSHVDQQCLKGESWSSQKLRVVFYTCIILIGVAFMVVQIEELLRGLIFK